MTAALSLSRCKHQVLHHVTWPMSSGHWPPFKKFLLFHKCTHDAQCTMHICVPSTRKILSYMYGGAAKGSDGAPGSWTSGNTNLPRGIQVTLHSIRWYFCKLNHGDQRQNGDKLWGGAMVLVNVVWQIFITWWGKLPHIKVWILDWVFNSAVKG